ncbi:mediator of RNA polymerase II transcription subunit 31 [Symphalangus syndactylus]|uniref:mediator of RNA polymerase II transcription subunit 31 n=1 Tax=Symphalangus syndactylus TaxID=9590 RepID=UPI00300624F1
MGGASPPHIPQCPGTGRGSRGFRNFPCHSGLLLDQAGGVLVSSFVMAAAVAMETDDAGNRLRFQLELEFVQCLANPNYLNFLAQRGYFKDKAFVNYLKYLLYWKDPEYAKYLKYPQCLHMLELLQYEHFRKELVNAQCAKFIDEQQILHWQHYSRKRMRLQQALAEQQQQNNTSGK